MRKIFISIIFLLCLFIPINSIDSVDANESNSIILTYNNKVWYYDMKAPNLSDNFLIQSDHQKRLNYLKNYSLKEIYQKLSIMGYTSDQIYNFLLPEFDTILLDICQQIEKPAIEPEIKFYPNNTNMFHFSKESVGVKVDTQGLLNMILSEQKLISIPTTSINPKYTQEQLYYNTTLRSKQSTAFIGSEPGRKHNLTKALTMFNGLVVMPGEKLSFNKITGERTYANGYKDAIVISNGEFVKGAGGGVCQASTTLYNAVLMAGLQVNNVYRHTLPVHYVEKGFDAMVNDDTVDMCFTNNTKFPIYIKTYCENEHAYALIYGEDMKGITYKKSTEKIKDILPQEAEIIPDTEGIYQDKIRYKGEFYTKRYAQNGYEVNAYLEKYLEGKLIERKLVRHETYKSQHAIIYEGTEDKPNSATIDTPTKTKEP